MSSQPVISVVIPVFNQVALTERCLESLLAHSRVARELAVVDNASSDRTPEVLKTFVAPFESAGWTVRLIRNEENKGFGRACNQGVRATSGEFVAILNNDTWLMPGWDDALLKNARRLNATMVGPYYDEKPFEEARMVERASLFTSRNRGKTSRDWVSILMLFRRNEFEALGLFDERFFVTSEDADLRERMDRAGHSYFQVADSYIWHHSKGTRDKPGLPSGYEAEGLRLFTEKWGFDPRAKEATRGTRLRRRWKKLKKGFGLF